MPINLGELLVKTEAIFSEQLQAALDYQKLNGGKLARALVSLGFVSDEDIAKLLSRQYGVPWIGLERHEIDPAVIRMLPAETARKYHVVPLTATGRVLTIAMADPTNVFAIDDISFMTGRNVKQVVASESALEHAIDRYYGSTRSLELRRDTVAGGAGYLGGPTLSVDDLAAMEVAPGPVDASLPDPPARSRATGPTTPVSVPPPTPVVWSLVTVNAVVFALELLWGGSSSPFTLHRMGALLGRAGLADEPWRIVSAAFLHINIIHLALNMWALVVFGRMLEMTLGARRFIVLYALSAAGGGLASSLVHAQILSVGASGAVWGLMAAQIALIVRLKWQEGAERVPVRTSTLLKPLVINLLFSLLPFIDLAAHLGGGLVGAGLIFSGLIWGPRPAAAWRPAACAASLAIAGCLAVALAQGRPWELRWPPPLVPRAIADTLVNVPVPGGLNADASDEENVTVFGNRFRDPLVLYCDAEWLDTPCSDPQRRACLSKTARDLAAKPLDRGWSWDQPPRVVQLRARPAAFWAIRSEGGLRQMTWMMMEESWWLRLDAVLHPDAAASWAELPSAIADGIAISSEASSGSDPERSAP